MVTNQTETFSAMEFAMGYKKTFMSSCDTQNQNLKKFEKNVTKTYLFTSLYLFIYFTTTHNIHF